MLDCLSKIKKFYKNELTNLLIFISKIYERYLLIKIYLGLCLFCFINSFNWFRPGYQLFLYLEEELKRALVVYFKFENFWKRKPTVVYLWASNYYVPKFDATRYNQIISKCALFYCFDVLSKINMKGGIHVYVLKRRARSILSVLV